MLKQELGLVTLLCK